MKIGVSSYSFAKYINQTGCDYFKICDIAREIGFDGIEFVGLESYTKREDLLTLAGEIKEYCASIGLEICAYTVGADLMAEDLASQVEKLKVCVDIASALGAPVMRHDVCYTLPASHLFTWHQAIERMAPAIREVSEYAAEKGIKTCTENHGRIFQHPETVEALILAVGSENYGWLFDMGNFVYGDADPVRAMCIASKHIFHVHAKDFIFKSGECEAPDGFMSTVAGNYIRGTVIGHGSIPVKTCINALKKDGYSGYVSVEFEGMEECLPAIKSGYNYLKKLI